MKVERLEWDAIWMSMAELISRRSYDPRHQVGALVVTFNNSQVLSIGYNGNYSGGPNCVENEEPGMSGMIHAEINALLKLDYNNPQKKKMYITLSPCKMCAKSIVNAGIDEVIYGERYRDPAGLQVLESVGIQARHYKT